MAYIPNDLLKCVVFIGYRQADGKDKFAGSAFWISRPGPEDIANEYRPAYLVTAAHVIEEVKKNLPPGDYRVRIRVNRKTEGQDPWIDTPLPSWKTHPDPAVDLAVLKIGLDKTLDHFAWPTEGFVSAQSIEDDGRQIELGDELFCAGLFWPHKGERKNIPIVRMANVAALRGEPVLNRDGHLMDAYLVESRSIGGLSGSPVFIDVLTAKAAFVGKHAYLKGKDSFKFRLIGVMHGHFDWPDVEPDAVADDGKEEIGVNMGIAIVVPAEKIMEVLEQFMKEEEQEAERAREKKRSYVVMDSLPQPNVTAQVTSTGIKIPVPTKDQVLADFEKASRKKD